MTFSRPVSAELKPTPSASNVETLPSISMRPFVGARMPATARMSVDLPAPLAPMTPVHWPLGTLKVTPRTARTSR